jgi:hypothetical protein
MGAHSTIRVTAQAARKYLLTELFNAPSATLETMMDAALSDRLYNVRIVDDEEENDDAVL